MDAAPDALVIVDHDGMIVLTNRLTEALFGYPQADLVGQQIEVLLPERLRHHHVDDREHYATHPVTRSMGSGLELFGRHHDGHEFAVEISLSPWRTHTSSLIMSAIRDVSERKHLEAEVRERDRRFHALFDHASQFIALLARDGTVLEVNDSALHLGQLADPEMTGGPVWETSLWLVTSGITEQIRTAVQQAQQGSVTHMVLDYPRDAQTLLTFEMTFTPLRDDAGQVVLIVMESHDITRQRQLEQAALQRAHDAEQRQALFRMMINALPSGVYLVQGSDARMVLANKAASDIWGAPWVPGETMETFLATTGVRIEGFDGHDLAQHDWATLRATGGGESVHQHQEVIRHPDGTSNPILVNAVALPAAAMLAVGTADEPGALVVLQDVTPLKETERMKDEFLGIAAHELRTPLAALKGFTDMLIVQTARGRGAPLVAWQTEALRDIEQATQRLVRLVNGLLDVTRVQGGQLVLSLEMHDLVAVARRVLQEQQALTDRHHLDLTVPAEPVVMTFDVMRIEQVLVNLLQNAVKYSPDGGDVGMTISTSAETHEVVVQIHDNGIGIPVNQQSHLFTRFGRAENSVGIQGTGLGLYLCRELIERHHGHIWIDSSEGQGATVSFSLPTDAALG